QNPGSSVDILEQGVEAGYRLSRLYQGEGPGQQDVLEHGRVPIGYSGPGSLNRFHERVGNVVRAAGSTQDVERDRVLLREVQVDQPAVGRLPRIEAGGDEGVEDVAGKVAVRVDQTDADVPLEKLEEERLEE